ncbi:hypothetical protein G6F70_000066 [Rhizopus microsporus]|nr:hypothetical protein G6F71_003617 [Rhizopus microsporus]KAG1204929.1 hypothetical protein G6F70_000066 [Rhizopus microsporus]KAG1216461.1 hypothetical protein G6F69_000032 [Rhizopus microsporus]KAG1235505.1 hypothetical protein G6F67_002709 [Rhizopus microsporus]KAG1264289.1 hypothetical protein G6F68_004469 [Rhizopus microsporus]
MTYATAIITMFPNDNQSDIPLVLRCHSRYTIPQILGPQLSSQQGPVDGENLLASRYGWFPTTLRFGTPPKEKRRGQRIVKTITIHPHHNPLLCPVAVFEECKQRIASSDCRTAHPLFPTIKLTRLFRSLQNHTTPIAAERISKHIKQIMTKVGRPAQAPIPKARGLAATLAAQAGASADNIVAHGS